jgi:hypothetical protein
MPLRMGPMGRGGARRRTRRRMSRRQASLSTQQKAQIEQQAGKSVDDMTDEELGAEMKKRGIEVPEEEGGGESDGEKSDTGDYTAELEKLAGLRDKGILTEEEFQAKKKQILGL